MSTSVKAARTDSPTTTGVVIDGEHSPAGDHHDHPLLSTLICVIDPVTAQLWRTSPEANGLWRLMASE